MRQDSYVTTRLSFTFGREAYRAALILIEEGAISRAGFNGPYEKSSRQVGFVNYGVSHVMRLVGSAELAQRASWYQKWNVHMFARPEVRFHYLTNSDRLHGWAIVLEYICTMPLPTTRGLHGHSRCLVRLSPSIRSVEYLPPRRFRSSSVSPPALTTLRL